MQLSTGQTSGVYTSRPLDTFPGCGPINTWTKFEWKTPIPFGKELPTSTEIATDYADISANLQTGIQEYFRMNGTGAIASGTTMTATVGSNALASNSNGAGMTYLAAGKINSGITFDGTDDSFDIPYVQTSVSGYSVAAWFKTNTAGNGVILQDRGSGAGRSLTLGIGNNPGGCAAGRISYGLDSNAIYIGKCTTSTYNDNSWRHVVGVWAGTSGTAVAAAQFTIYVDGSSVAQSNISVGTAPNAPISGLGNTRIGRHDAWGVNYAGSLDEVIVWNRALTANEVQQIYRRGGNNLKFQIKFCDLNDCSDVATWKGYDNTSATFFTELNNNTVPNTGLGNPLTTYPLMTFTDFPSFVVPTKRFIQYQATLTSDVTTFQPEFTFVRITPACTAGSVTYTSSGTFTVPNNCRTLTIKAWGAGGGGGGPLKSGVGAGGGYAVKTISSGLTSGETFSFTIGSGGTRGGTGTGGGGAGGNSGGTGGSASASGSDGSGATAGGTGGTPNSTGGSGGNGKFGGGGGGGGGGGAGELGGGGGGSTLVVRSTGAVNFVEAGGGGGGGSGGNSGSGDGGAGGGGCSANGGNGTSTGTKGGGGGGGACVCSASCDSTTAGSGTTPGNSAEANGNATGGAANSSGAAGDGGGGQVIFIYN